MNISQKKEYLSVLLDIKGGCRNDLQGLCMNIHRRWRNLGEFKGYMKNQFESWPKFSGSLLYPIGPNPESAMDLFNDTFDMYEGEYGKLRLELLDHMISETEKDIENEHQNSITQ